MASIDPNHSGLTTPSLERSASDSESIASPDSMPIPAPVFGGKESEYLDTSRKSKSNANASDSDSSFPGAYPRDPQDALDDLADSSPTKEVNTQDTAEGAFGAMRGQFPSREQVMHVFDKATSFLPIGAGSIGTTFLGSESPNFFKQEKGVGQSNQNEIGQKRLDPGTASLMGVASNFPIKDSNKNKSSGSLFDQENIAVGGIASECGSSASETFTPSQSLNSIQPGPKSSGLPWAPAPHSGIATPLKSLQNTVGAFGTLSEHKDDSTSKGNHQHHNHHHHHGDILGEPVQNVAAKSLDHPDENETFTSEKSLNLTSAFGAGSAAVLGGAAAYDYEAQRPIPRETLALVTLSIPPPQDSTYYPNDLFSPKEVCFEPNNSLGCGLQQFDTTAADSTLSYQSQNLSSNHQDEIKDTFFIPSDTQQTTDRSFNDLSCHQTDKLGTNSQPGSIVFAADNGQHVINEATNSQMQNRSGTESCLYPWDATTPAAEDSSGTPFSAQQLHNSALGKPLFCKDEHDQQGFADNRSKPNTTRPGPTTLLTGGEISGFLYQNKDGPRSGTDSDFPLPSTGASDVSVPTLSENYRSQYDIMADTDKDKLNDTSSSEQRDLLEQGNKQKASSVIPGLIGSVIGIGSAATLGGWLNKKAPIDSTNQASSKNTSDSAVNDISDYGNNSTSTQIDDSTFGTFATGNLINEPPNLSYQPSHLSFSPLNEPTNFNSFEDHPSIAVNDSGDYRNVPEPDEQSKDQGFGNSFCDLESQDPKSFGDRINVSSILAGDPTEIASKREAAEYSGSSREEVPAIPTPDPVYNVSGDYKADTADNITSFEGMNTGSERTTTNQSASRPNESTDQDAEQKTFSPGVNGSAFGEGGAATLVGSEDWRDQQDTSYLLERDALGGFGAVNQQQSAVAPYTNADTDISAQKSEDILDFSAYKTVPVIDQYDAKPTGISDPNLDDQLDPSGKELGLIGSAAGLGGIGVLSENLMDNHATDYPSEVQPGSAITSDSPYYEDDAHNEVMSRSFNGNDNDLPLSHSVPSMITGDLPVETSDINSPSLGGMVASNVEEGSHLDYGLGTLATDTGTGYDAETTSETNRVATDSLLSGKRDSGYAEVLDEREKKTTSTHSPIPGLIGSVIGVGGALALGGFLAKHQPVEISRSTHRKSTSSGAAEIDPAGTVTGSRAGTSDLDTGKSAGIVGFAAAPGEGTLMKDTTTTYYDTRDPTGQYSITTTSEPVDKSRYYGTEGLQENHPGGALGSSFIEEGDEAGDSHVAGASVHEGAEVKRESTMKKLTRKMKEKIMNQRNH